MRESENLGLRWDDLDREKLVIRVRRAQYQGQINPTKSERSERGLPYGEIVSDALTRLRISGQGGKEYLFVTPKGTLFRGSDVGGLWEKSKAYCCQMLQSCRKSCN